MIARTVVSGACCAGLILVERSLVAALPEPWLHLPLVLAAAHNAVAALLLAALVMLNFNVFQRPPG